MKKYGIIVSEKNRKKIEAEISEVQSNNMKRIIDFSDIVSTCKKIESQLPIPKSNLEDCKFQVNLAAQKLPIAYVGKYGSPKSTQFTLLFHCGSWHILEIVRDYMRNTNNEVRAELTEKAEDSLIKYHTDFTV